MIINKDLMLESCSCFITIQFLFKQLLQALNSFFKFVLNLVSHVMQIRIVNRLHR